MACEMDLSCSESSADLSEELSPASELDCELAVMQFRISDYAEADAEVERLRSNERHSMPPVDYVKGSAVIEFARTWAVDAVCSLGERLNFNFTTSALAVNILDRFLATCENAHDAMFTLAAVACLSIAAKLEEAHFLPSNARMLHEMFPAGEYSLGDLMRMELTVLSVLGWRTLGVTPANILDPLICLLDLAHPVLHAAGGGLEVACTLREGCKLLLARSIRGTELLNFRPSSIVAAAVFTVLEELSYPINVWAVIHPLKQRFASQADEIAICSRHLQPLLRGLAVSTIFKNCRLDVDQNNVVRVLPLRGGCWTPTSVLDTSLRQAFVARPAVGGCDTCDTDSSYAEWQLQGVPAGCPGAPNFEFLDFR